MAGTQDPRPRMVAESIDAGVPTARKVQRLDEALSVVTRIGGAITSETRTAPGIGSWAFVVDREGREVVLWETAGLAG
jgi:predicted enzyme related to lactoylglutathione lyase